MGDERFSPKELVFNNEMASSLVFKDEDDAEAFLKGYRDGGEPVAWVGTLGGHSDGRRVVRVERDATFDQRLRGQVCYRLKQRTTNFLSKKVKWGANMRLDNSGIRGAFFCTNGDEIWELFRVKFAHCGGGEFIKPNVKNFVDWGASKEEIEEVVDLVMAPCTLRDRGE